jgi:chorismate-pyruvate lyase
MTRWLQRMGNRSLGALLFAHAGFKRGKLECRRLDQRHPLFEPAISAMPSLDSHQKNLWARRSSFSFGGQAVLVTEIFSPEVCRDPKPDRPPEK